MSGLSKTQIDKLGDRLKKGDVTESDLRLLDEYRLSFTDAYEFVVGNLKQQLNLSPTGRPAKSTPSITDKLRRESIRLTQMQDIAGCRLVVLNIQAQDNIVAEISKLFAEISIIDRRTTPSHGYRAVHVVVNRDGKFVEVQIRTELQHFWADLSEKLADQFDASLKYGGGDPSINKILSSYSSLGARIEAVEGKGGDKPGPKEPGGPSKAAELEAIAAATLETMHDLIAILRRRRDK